MKVPIRMPFIAFSIAPSEQGFSFTVRKNDKDPQPLEQTIGFDTLSEHGLEWAATFLGKTVLASLSIYCPEVLKRYPILYMPPPGRIDIEPVVVDDDDGS